MGFSSLFLSVLVLHLCVTSSASDPLRPSSEQAHEYLRFADVERQCQSVLASAAALSDDAYRATRLKLEMSFDKGDWHQDAGRHAPLVPFDSSDDALLGRPRLDPISLATFAVTHVGDDGRRRAGTTAVNVSGVLVLSVSRKSRDQDDVGPNESPQFELSPGRTKLKITFQGVYTESGNGERVLCMVGNALLPRRTSTGGPTGSADPWDWANNSSSGSGLNMAPVTADGNILLVLCYPKELTLTTRAVVGEMRSTSAASAATYFDPVHLVSQLHNTLYQFRSQDLVAAACDSAPSSDAVVGDRARHLYTGGYPCEALERYSYGRGRVVAALPNWHGCNSMVESCRRLGPFEMVSPNATRRYEPRGVGIVIHDLKCNVQNMPGGAAMVSAVFRVAPPSEDPYTVIRRSGMSGTTLSAEGVWNASAGQACLAACRGAGNESCHFRVCLYMPMTFSIADRSILLGRITSINAPEHSSLSFRLGLSLPQYWGWDGERLAFRYNYTLVKRAGELLQRKVSPFSLRRIIARLLPLSYPKTDHRTSLGYLADSLALRFTTAPSIFTPEWIENPVVHLEVIFLGQTSDRGMSRAGKGRGSEMGMDLPINVSAELTVFGNPWAVSSVMSLEGVYDPKDGRMCLIGCRDRGLREGMDCSIEVKVDYPPTTTHWFIWSTAKVRIASTRNPGDPLRFSAMKLQAVPFRYPQTRPHDLNRGLADGVLGIALLSASIAASLSQMRHLNAHADVAPYVSLVTTCVQGVGFGLPVITGIDALLARLTTTPPPSSRDPSPSLVYSRPYQSMDKMVRILSLAAFLISRGIFQEVRRSRARTLARSSPLDSGRVPSEAKVVACFSAAHVLLALLVLAVNGRTMTVEEHVGLMQDLFLLPQVIGNAVWRVNCKPLAEGYYLGITAARMLPHFYNCVRPPMVPLYDVQSVNASRSLFSLAVNAVVPAVSILLALLVYVQQRWNYLIANRMGFAGQPKLQHVI